MIPLLALILALGEVPMTAIKTAKLRMERPKDRLAADIIKRLKSGDSLFFREV